MLPDVIADVGDAAPGAGRHVVRLREVSSQSMAEGTAHASNTLCAPRCRCPGRPTTRSSESLRTSAAPEGPRTPPGGVGRLRSLMPATVLAVQSLSASSATFPS
eukprot:13398869-Alexandrium_andersonii.AAC.1